MKISELLMLFPMLTIEAAASVDLSGRSLTFELKNMTICLEEGSTDSKEVRVTAQTVDSAIEKLCSAISEKKVFITRIPDLTTLPTITV